MCVKNITFTAIKIVVHYESLLIVLVPPDMIYMSFGKNSMLPSNFLRENGAVTNFGFARNLTKCYKQNCNNCTKSYRGQSKNPKMAFKCNY